MNEGIFTTIYLTDDIEFTPAEISSLERCIGAEIAEGHDFVNIYSKDSEVIDAFVSLVGEWYIKEIAR